MKKALSGVLDHRLLGCVVAAVIIAILSQSVCAHTLWIESSRYKVKKGLAKPMFFGWGHYLPVDDAISGNKLSYIRIFDPDGRSNEIAVREEKSLHSYLIKYDQVGTYRLVRFSFKKKATGEEAIKCNQLNYKTTLVFQVSGEK